jgi:chromosome segregation ATPase
VEQKIKIIIIALSTVIVLSLFTSLSVYRAKKIVERERNSLKEENSALNGKVEQALLDKKNLEDKVNSLTQDIQKITLQVQSLSKEKQDLQDKYDSLAKERDSLSQQVKAMDKQDQKRIQDALAAKEAEQTAYWGSVLKRKSELEVQLENLKEDITSYKLAAEQLNNDKAELTLEVNNLNRNNQDLKRQLDYLQGNQGLTDSLSQELAMEKKNKITVESVLRSTQDENLLLRRQMKRLTSNKMKTETRLSELQAKNLELKNNINKIETLLQERMLQVSSYINQAKKGKTITEAAEEEQKGSVELPTIIVKPKAETDVQEPSSSALVGKILSINRENNFAIIDFGEDAGIKVGDGFAVIRTGQKIANLEVIQTRRNISACDIKNETLSVEAGDTVR